jgi:hypothetical protein
MFQPEDRVELLDGLLVMKEPQDAPHAAACGLAQARLWPGLGIGIAHG